MVFSKKRSEKLFKFSDEVKLIKTQIEFVWKVFSSSRLALFTRFKWVKSTGGTGDGAYSTHKFTLFRPICVSIFYGYGGFPPTHNFNLAPHETASGGAACVKISMPKLHCTTTTFTTFRVLSKKFLSPEMSQLLCCFASDFFHSPPRIKPSWFNL